MARLPLGLIIPTSWKPNDRRPESRSQETRKDNLTILFEGFLSCLEREKDWLRLMHFEFVSN